MTLERAETIGLLALGWLAGNDELLPVFLGSTGAGIEDLRARAADRDFLAAVLDFVTLDDAWVLALCSAHALSAEEPLRARQVLSGEVHWT